MVARALDAGVPCEWVLGDAVHGADRRLRVVLAGRGQPYLLGIRGNDKRWSELEGRVGQHAPEDLAGALPPQAWRRLGAGAGSKGERLHDWARVRLVRLQEPPWDHRPLVRRSSAGPQDLAYFVVFGPAGLRLLDLARVAGRRWPVEACLEAGKQEVGLADYEVRSRHGWDRHVTLAMLALALLAALRAGLNAAKGGGAPPASCSCPSACPSFLA
jgi:SRSO17 transposase